jgi:hypothetical protein
MREFTYIDSITITFHAAGETVSFINGVCRLDNPSPIQLGLLDEKIAKGSVSETTPFQIIEPTPDKKKSKPSKRAAKKKGG